MSSTNKKRVYSSDSDESVSTPLTSRNKKLDNKMVRGTPLNGSFLRTPTVLLTRVNDDNFTGDKSRSESHHEFEKNERIMRAISRKSLLNKSFNNSTHTPSRPSVQNLPFETLSKHYTECIKLSASNKINPNNAFKLNLIDFMSEYFRKQDDQIFISASTALDAGAKIYSNRVDCVHAEAHKVASGLMMALDDKGNKINDLDEDENEHDEGREDDGDEPKPKKKKVKKRSINTIVQNIETLNISKIESTLEIDPVFYQLSSQFDVGNVNGLLMYNLRIDTEGMLMLNSNSTIEKDENHQSISDQLISISKIHGYLDESFKFKSQICPKNLSEFEFLKRDAALDIIINNDDFENNNKDTYKYDMNEQVEDVNDNDFGDNQDDFGDCDSVTDEEDEENLPHKSLLRAVNMVGVKDVASFLSYKPNDYSYFDLKLFGTWAGPNHWKRMPRKKGEEEQTRTKKQRKMYEEIDFFTQEIPEDADLIAKIKKIVDGKKKDSDINRLKEQTVKKWTKNCKELQLQEDHSFDVHSLLQSYLKSELHFNYPKTDEKVFDTFMNDEENVLPPDSPGDRYDDDDDYAFPTGETQDSNPPTSGFNTDTDQFAFAGDNLVDQPYDINQISLPYARVAKKMDVKRLKKAIWDVLTIDEQHQQTEQSNQVS